MRGRTPTQAFLPAERMESAKRFRERFLQMWDSMGTFPPATHPSDVPREDTEAASGSFMPGTENAAVGINVVDAAMRPRCSEDEARVASHGAEDELYRLTPGLKGAIVKQAPPKTTCAWMQQEPHEEPWPMAECAAGQLPPRDFGQTQPVQFPDVSIFHGVTQGSPAGPRLTFGASESAISQGERQPQCVPGAHSRPSPQEAQGNYYPMAPNAGSPGQEVREHEHETGQTRSVIKERAVPRGYDVQHFNPAMGLPSTVLVSSRDIPRDPRRLLFVLELSDEELVKHGSKHGASLLAFSCRQAWGGNEKVSCTEHNERVYSVLFRTAWKAVESEGMRVMSHGCPVQAEHPPPHSPSSFFWNDDRGRVDDRDMMLALQRQLPALCGPMKLYRQSIGSEREFVISFDRCPQLLRIGLPLLVHSGELIWAWFKARSPYESCRMCGKRHPARCVYSAERLL
ncbi:hypothetical protein CERZMDRAFT_103205 [Cercospora zeae-maydis SCOH1-5]|uniref:Uncharacterized protein n=1 Tax=Cercospora zeae-maydis SCOH1-5 TaxID=717836 RepID=A0A6A6F023_9PEZI|nr:hypothetical protein CERZMDRAFT_103205 [Cercospora zeae-maydis SCOH1-5]